MLQFRKKNYWGDHESCKAEVMHIVKSSGNITSQWLATREILRGQGGIVGWCCFVRENREVMSVSFGTFQKLCGKTVYSGGDAMLLSNGIFFKKKSHQPLEYQRATGVGCRWSPPLSMQMENLYNGKMECINSENRKGLIYHVWIIVWFIDTKLPCKFKAVHGEIW